MSAAKPECGAPCSNCGREMVEISAENLRESVQRINPSFKSLPTVTQRKDLAWYPICPRCDAYALGLDLDEGIPFRCRDGREMTIHELNQAELWGNDA